MQYELSAVQMAYIAIIASALVTGLRLLYEYAQKKKFEVPNIVMLLIVFVVSVGLALVWWTPVFPPWIVFTGDPSVDTMSIFTWISQALVPIGYMLGAAVFIYEILLKRVKEGLGQAFLPLLYPIKPVKK